MADNRMMIVKRYPMVEGFTRVQRDDGRYNYEKPDGELIGDTWYYTAYDFCGGFAPVQRKEDGPWNFIKPDGGLISDTGYYNAYDFHEGFARVQLKAYGPWYRIDTTGKLLEKLDDN